jgi:uncharacterized Zn-binding protein involved in type VI secretion
MATVAIHPPKTPVTKGSNGVATATLPNVCKMPPPPPPFAPTPLPNIGQSGKTPQGYSTTVKIEGNPVAILGASFGSTGDIASKATGGGIISNNAEGQTKFIAPGSFTVRIQGRNVHLLSDIMSNNNGPAGAPPNSATLMGLLQVTAGVIPPDLKAAAELCEEKVEQDVAAGKLTTTGKKPSCANKGTWKHSCCKDLLENQYSNVVCENNCGSSNSRLDVAVIDPPGAKPGANSVAHIFDFKFSCSGKKPLLGYRQSRKYRRQFPSAKIAAIGP